MRLVDALAVDPDMPFIRDALRPCPGLGETQEPKQTVDPHAARSLWLTHKFGKRGKGASLPGRHGSSWLC